MSTKNLLVELFVEELPPKALKKIGDAFSQTLQSSLKAQGLTSDDSAARYRPFVCSLHASALSARLIPLGSCSHAIVRGSGHSVSTCQR